MIYHDAFDAIENDSNNGWRALIEGVPVSSGSRSHGVGAAMTSTSEALDTPDRISNRIIEQ